MARQFFITNQDIFLRYFDSMEHYRAAIQAGSSERIIRSKSEFSLEQWWSDLNEGKLWWKPELSTKS